MDIKYNGVAFDLRFYALCSFSAYQRDLPAPVLRFQRNI